MAVSGWTPSFSDCARCGPAARTVRSTWRRVGRCVPPAVRPDRPPRGPRPWCCWGAAVGEWELVDDADQRVQREGSSLVAAFVQWHLERQLRSLPLVEAAP